MSYLLPGAVAFFAACGHAAVALAQVPAYPAKPIRIVVPFPSGGFSDTLGRLIGQKLSESLGQPVVNDNRPGASGTIGGELVAKSAPDGYTLLTASLNYVVKPNIEKLPYDTQKDFAAVSLVAQGPPLVLVVRAASAYRTLSDIVADGRAHPGKLTFASAGPGSSGHLTAELLRSLAGINIVQVPYKGSVLGVTATISGEVAVAASYLPVVLPLVKSGRLRGVALTSPTRSPLLPEVATAAEAGYPGCEVGGMMGLVAPAGTPRNIIRKLNAALAAIVARPDFVELLEGYGMQASALSPEDFERYISEQIVRWGKVLKNGNALPAGEKR
ncbi:MAG: tripartite tricarboxylate transporter substrate binding protein [Betaproteobacteria bacterium]